MYRIRRLSPVMGALMLVGCTGRKTQLVSSWRAADAERVRFARVLAVYPAPDPAVRRTVEDQLAATIRSGIASYTLIPDGEVFDRREVQRRLSSSRIDGVVVFRRIGVDVARSYTLGAASTGTGASDLYGYWRAAWQAAHEPGYTHEDRAVIIDVAVYDATRTTLVWSGRTMTQNWSSVRHVVAEVVEVVGDELKRQGLVR
jgi:hypothetical protein